jgi:two-component system, NarL family, nitrate/nitrite response regulator NarL
LGPVRILIVDDSERWRRSVHALLSILSNLEVISEAADGLEAVQKCEQLQPDLVLLDIHLPKLSGFEVARRISELSPSPKILFLSSYQSLDVMKEALRVGSGFVVKVDAARDLLPVVRAMIRDEPFIGFKFLKDAPSE